MGVEMVDSSHPDTSSGDAKGGVLNYRNSFIDVALVFGNQMKFANIVSFC